MRLIIPDHARRRARERGIDLRPFVALARRLTAGEARAIPARRVALRTHPDGPVAILEVTGDRLVLATVLPPGADLGTTPVLTWCELQPGAARLTRARWRELQAIDGWCLPGEATAELRTKLLEDAWTD